MQGFLESTKKGFNLLMGSAAEAIGGKPSDDNQIYLKNNKDFETINYQTEQIYKRLTKFSSDLRKILIADGNCIDLLARTKTPNLDEKIGAFEASSISLLCSFETKYLKLDNENKPFTEFMQFRDEVKNCEKIKGDRRESELLLSKASFNVQYQGPSYQDSFVQAQINYEKQDRLFNDTVRNLLSRRDNVFGAVLNALLFGINAALKDADVCADKMVVEYK